MPSIRVEVFPQVADFLRSLAPEPRRAVRAGLRDLERGRGDVKSLEGDLKGFCRLRVAGYRVIIRHRFSRGRHIVDCVFAERRAVVYELFTAIASLMPRD